MPITTKHGLACLALLAATLPASAATVTVQSGDTLSSIAARELGNDRLWPALCEANADVLEGNCDRLPIGTVISLPGQSEPEPTQATDETPAQPASEASAEPDVEPAAQEAVEPVAEPETEAPAESGTESPDLPGTYVAAWSDLPDPVIPRGFTVERRDDALRLSGSTENTYSTGRTGGIAFRLPDAVEQAVSGKTIRIHILAVPVGGASADIEAAYSTNEVGNSGWRPITVGDGPAMFRYAVREIEQGKGDFVGIFPDPEGTGQVIDLLALSIEIVD
ncbi:LysM peptidoglycan-binding domain-containing protein [Pelagibacterium halotolerans]|uniref:LysM domain-containing protein n=1 Tax=Pelagibacterium halotolerans (strain DSM 22347 / JCM 15775 / CGMCC 1.7692 / B2) TaxID=1082931 RepID=G4RDK9_PELHB|nr:LysM domain-containing protein [Pelagibacterium halotolerans]AEQ51810.1 hypothetical protein KKY_1799 [Pelagibacterium halotolerans B2]QJR18380.1 LysM peptidoglycan-binding domain-containing protein [Pelagibacterium halotolerans]SEA24079.1 LysM domain-containing protein [Pelagibacterium halotolerans]